ncbi:NUDIX domain-containing protein [Nonomuraea harbinensis]|uniref:NUDIX domain-containing protein n=1 Tax=Nonomuraea harbinensis TaxID=1286938 RepID=A0ABW1BL05_9ACTN|nr:NUDIX domain-containing protein [Nonomuraea harbinensis]
MGFDGFLVPDWAKPYVGYAVGMDWPEGDEDGCFRLADACAATAEKLLQDRGVAVFTEPGEDWNGDALKEFVERVRYESDPRLEELVEQLVSAALHYNELGVQVEYTKRMIEVSVWFLIFQIGWLLAASAGPWGAMSLSLVGARVQLTRLAIAQLGKRLLINIGLFGGLMAGMDLAVQASQSRRDHLDWEQVMMSGGTGALLGAFLTAFTGLLPARTMLGLMGRSGLASGATDLTVQLGSGQPLDFDRLFKSVTSGVVGGADAHWASWSPFAHGRPDTTTNLAGTPTTGTSSTGGGFTSHSPGTHTAGHGLPPTWLTGGTTHPTTPASRPVAPPSQPGALSWENFARNPNITFESLLNGPRTADSQGTGVAGADSPSSPFQILDNPGKSGDGYVSGGLWGKYGAAGVLIRTMDSGEPRYLLMQQSQHVSNAGKWQLPGGALDSLETPVQAAARELSEELGVNQTYLNKLKLVGEHVVEVGDHGWTYTNLAAEGPQFKPKLDPFEASDALWFTRQQLNTMASQGQLHPALAKALPDVLSLYHKDADPAAPPIHHYTPASTTNLIRPPVDFAARATHDSPPASWHASHGKATSAPAYSGLASDGPGPPSVWPTVHGTESGLYYTAPAPHVPLDAPFGARLVGNSFGEAIWTSVYRDMSPAELEVGKAYSRNGFTDMNGYLRQGDSVFHHYSPDARTAHIDRVVREIELLDGVLRRKPLPETIDVYRAVDLTPKLFTVPVDELPGTVQRDPAFFSTNLGHKPVWDRSVILHLRVPAGTPAFYLALLSTFRENELLLGSDVSWFAEDVYRRDGTWHVYGWVLPPEESGG